MRYTPLNLIGALISAAALGWFAAEGFWAGVAIEWFLTVVNAVVVLADLQHNR